MQDRPPASRTRTTIHGSACDTARRSRETTRPPLRRRPYFPSSHNFCSPRHCSGGRHRTALTVSTRPRSRSLVIRSASNRRTPCGRCRAPRQWSYVGRLRRSAAAVQYNAPRAHTPRPQAQEPLSQWTEVWRLLLFNTTRTTSGCCCCSTQRLRRRSTVWLRWVAARRRARARAAPPLFESACTGPYRALPAQTQTMMRFVRISSTSRRS